MIFGLFFTFSFPCLLVYLAISFLKLYNWIMFFLFSLLFLAIGFILYSIRNKLGLFNTSLHKIAYQMPWRRWKTEKSLTLGRNKITVEFLSGMNVIFSFLIHAENHPYLNIFKHIPFCFSLLLSLSLSVYLSFLLPFILILSSCYSKFLSFLWIFCLPYNLFFYELKPFSRLKKRVDEKRYLPQQPKWTYIFT